MTICKFEPITHAKIVRINIHDADEDDGDVFNASYIIRRIQDFCRKANYEQGWKKQVKRFLKKIF